MKIYRSFLLVFILLGLTGSFALADDHEKTSFKPLVFATPEHEGVLTDYLIKVFKEISRRSGIPTTILEVPKERCLVDANHGTFDGVAARIIGLESRGYGNLRMINSSHYTVQHVIFAKKADVIRDVSNHDNFLRNAIQKDYIVGYLLGSKKAEKLLAELPPKNKIALLSGERSFFLLERERIDAYLAGPGIVNRAILKEKFSQSKIREAAVVSETHLFPYVHKAHAPIVQSLKHTLDEMRQDGTLANIKRDLLK